MDGVLACSAFVAGLSRVLVVGDHSDRVPERVEEGVATTTVETSASHTETEKECTADTPVALAELAAPRVAHDRRLWLPA